MLKKLSAILVVFLALPVSSFAITEGDTAKGNVLVRIPDQYLNANSFSLPTDGKAIVADLAQMKVVLYENGVATETLPILSKGRKGTPWETPGGVYQVLLKEKNHFSSLGHVFMPWSMQFYGNFFIHGWPYDADGNDVPRGYSGGCVRLSTPDAERVYRFTERGTPVIVRTHNDQDLSGGYYVSGSMLPPAISASSLVVMDLDRGQIIWKKNADEELHDPLVNKYLSALASLEHMNQYTPRNLPKNAFTDRSWTGRRSALPAKDLVAPLLFMKGVSIETIFATAHGKGLFIRAMSEKAKAFGMLHTHIADLGGASTTNVTTATDMVHLLRALDQSKRYLLEVTSMPLIALPDEEGEEPVVVTNSFLLPQIDATFRGGLSDRTSGNSLFVLSVETPRGVRSLAVALAGSVTVEEDIDAVAQYLRSGVTFVPGVSDAVVTEEPVGFFTKVRMIWNRKRIGDMLLGRETTQSRSAKAKEVISASL